MDSLSKCTVIVVLSLLYRLCVATPSPMDGHGSNNYFPYQHHELPNEVPRHGSSRILLPHGHFIQEGQQSSYYDYYDTLPQGEYLQHVNSWNSLPLASQPIYDGDHFLGGATTSPSFQNGKSLYHTHSGTPSRTPAFEPDLEQMNLSGRVQVQENDPYGASSVHSTQSSSQRQHRPPSSSVFTPRLRNKFINNLHNELISFQSNHSTKEPMNWQAFQQAQKKPQTRSPKPASTRDNRGIRARYYPQEHEGDLDVPFDASDEQETTPPPQYNPMYHLLSPQNVSHKELSALTDLYHDAPWVMFPTKYQKAVASLLVERLKMKYFSAMRSARERVDWKMVCQLLSGDEEKVRHVLDHYKKIQLEWTKGLNKKQREIVIKKVGKTFHSKTEESGYNFLKTRNVSREDGIRLLHAKTKREVLDIEQNWERKQSKRVKDRQEGEEDNDEDAWKAFLN
jgi:hypothetical protein